MSTGSPNEETASHPPTSGLDLQDPDIICRLFKEAAQANLNARHRRGATAHLPNNQKLVMTGDLHDHGLNFQRIIKLAALHEAKNHHVILHEIIHGPNYVNRMDLSIRTLARVAALKLQYPDQVHLLQANHELAQLGGQGISKDGVDVIKAFDNGVEYIYSDDSGRVLAAMQTFIKSLLLAVRCPNGVFCSHSIPSPRTLERFDPQVIHRVPTDEDLQPRGPAYDMVWGRNHTPDHAGVLGKIWEANWFIMGHQPADMGYNVETNTILVLASDHAHGMALPISSTKQYDLDLLVNQMVPLASVVL